MTRQDLEGGAWMLLLMVERGAATVELTKEWLEAHENNPEWLHGWAGNAQYLTRCRASDWHGWTLDVFIDGGGWDYLDAVIAPDGSRLDFDDMSRALRLGYGIPDGDEPKWGLQ